MVSQNRLRFLPRLAAPASAWSAPPPARRPPKFVPAPMEKMVNFDGCLRDRCGFSMDFCGKHIENPWIFDGFSMF